MPSDDARQHRLLVLSEAQRVVELDVDGKQLARHELSSRREQPITQLRVARDGMPPEFPAAARRRALFAELFRRAIRTLHGLA